MLACAGRDEISNAHINANHRCIRGCLDGHDLIVGEREPPRAITLIELDACVELSCLPRLGISEGALVVRCQFDRHSNGLALLKYADVQPVIIGRIARLFQLDHITVGLNTGFAQGRHVPFTPLWLFGRCRKLPTCLLFVVLLQIILVLLIGSGPIGAPRPGDACRLHDGNTVPAF